MLKRLSVVGLSVCALAGLFAAPASAATATVCYDVSITVNGQTTAAADCIEA